MIQLVFHQPEVPPNTGTLMRTAACLGVPLHLVRPFGFLLNDTKLKRAAMDYATNAPVPTLHDTWDAFEAFQKKRTGRLIALTAEATTPYTDFSFEKDDWLILGSEGCGLPALIKKRAHSTLSIPMRPGMRSLNVAIAGAMVLGEALRQTAQLTL